MIGEQIGRTPLRASVIGLGLSELKDPGGSLHYN
jgi:hypothetical protein